MQDLQCQLGEFMTIEHFHHTGFLSIPDVRGVPRDIFRDSHSLVLGDFERAEARLLADTSPSGLALAKLSTLLFLKLQNLCNPIFQATLRSTYKTFYGTSFLLYYAYMLEYCHMSGVGTVIDIEHTRDQLSQAKLVLAFRTFIYDVIKFFAEIVRLVYHHLSCLGSSKEDLCGAVLFALSTCPDVDFVRFINVMRRDFILQQGPFSPTFSAAAQLDFLRKSTVAEYSLLSKDNRYNLGPPADGFILVAGKSPAVPAVPPSLPDSLPTFANKPAWEYVPPLPGKSNKREVEGRTLYWCTNHAKSPCCLTFVNNGQWVVHHPNQCHLKKPKAGPPSVTPDPSAVPPTVLVAALPAAPPVVPPPSSAGGSLSYSTVASGEPLLMRSKLKQILEGGDPTQVAGLFAFTKLLALLRIPILANPSDPVVRLLSYFF